MARKTKTKAPKIEKLTTEQEEEIEIKSLLKDERTHKITGSFILLIGLLFFVAFASYLFTWDEDQDKVLREGSSMLLGSESEVKNQMGTFGAYLSHFFIYKGFGIASFLICTLFFVVGINLILGKKVFNIWRNLRYVIVGLPVISVTAAVISQGSDFPWGGYVGNISRDYLYLMIGKIGTIALIAVAMLSYIIWRFNPSFALPSKKDKTAAPVAVSDDTSEIKPLTEQNFVNETEEEEEEEWEEEEEEEENDDVVLHPLKEKTVEIQPLKEEKPSSFEVKSKEKTPVLDPVVETPIALDPVMEEVKPVKPLEPTKTKAEVEEVALEINEAPIIKEEEPTPAQKVLASAPYDPVLDLKDYKFPKLDLLENYGSEKIEKNADELEMNKNQIITTLKNYDISIQRISATVGPTVTLYEIVPAPGVRISKIKNLEDDIALSLSALGIRIIAPIPGKGTIGIEVPNTKKTIVSMRTLLSSDKFINNKYSLPIALGKRIDNENFIVDLASMPHLLMAGATGQGKSVGLNAILVSLLYNKHPSQLKFVLVDPKKVELSIYRTIEKHFLARLPNEEECIITDTKKVIHTLNALCIEMDNRYDLLKEAGCRNIREYNEKFQSRKLNPEKGHAFLPFIVLVIDEFADLIMTAGKEVEMPIARLAQLARAVGIHLIIATQRPSVNIITGTIKANFPARIAFKVSSKIDSRTILDTGGAEQLIGRGDMLISYNGEVVRLQCAFVDTPEVDRIVDFIGSQRGYTAPFLLPEYVDEKDMEARGDFDANDKDPLFEDAARLIVASQIGSTSLLQRRMKLGYNRAGRLMDQLEAAGIVGPSQGSKARDVLIKTEADLEQHLRDLV